MNRNPAKQVSAISHRDWGGLAHLTFLLWLAAATSDHVWSEAQGSIAGSAFRATHVLGFDAEKHNQTGELAIVGDSVQFQRNGKPAAQISISSIQDISIGNEDKQVGGAPMMLAKTAAPFGGGRVVSLFSHKRYEVLTMEYLDNNGGVHFAVFQMQRGRGQPFKNALLTSGAHIGPSKDQAAVQSTSEVKNANE